jgi:tRNA ligase
MLGKTLIGNALKHLFGFGHTQSDDVTSKKTAPTFLKNIAALLEKKDVVYADRNNHLDKHYDELVEMPFNTKLGPGKTLKHFDVRFIAIMWDVADLPYHQVLRICSERVVKRGDNHQTLRPDPTIEAEHEAIVGQFLRNFSEPDEENFDRIVKVAVADDSRTTLGKVVGGIVEILGFDKPSEEALDEALASAAEYKTTTPYHAPARVSKQVRYFGLAPEINLTALVTSILSTTSDSSAQAVFNDIKAKSRITAKPHVTLSHEKNVEAEREANESDAAPGPHQTCWDQCKSLASDNNATSSTSMYRYNITHLVWDERVMSLIIDELHPCDEATIQLEVPEDYAKHLHITIGTRSEEISAYESRGLVAAARAGIASGQEEGEGDEVVEGGGKVRWFRVEGIRGEGRVRGMW